MKKENYLSLITLFSYNVKAGIEIAGFSKEEAKMFAGVIDLYDDQSIPEKAYDAIHPIRTAYAKNLDYVSLETLEGIFQLSEATDLNYIGKLRYVFNKVYFVKEAYRILLENYKDLYQAAKEASSEKGDRLHLIDISSKGKQNKIESEVHLRFYKLYTDVLFQKTLDISSAVFENLPYDFYKPDSVNANAANVLFKKIMAKEVRRYLDAMSANKNQKYLVLGYLFMVMKLIKDFPAFEKSLLAKQDQLYSKDELLGKYREYIRDEGKNYY